MIFHLERSDMRGFLIAIFFLSSFSIWAQGDLPEKPYPPRLVNDLTGTTLTASEQGLLERKLLAYEDSTSTQVAILIVNKLNGYEVVDYAQRVGEKWGVGTANKNNGVFIVVAIQDRKAAIVTGYGMEGSITDAATYTIREDYMNPRFQQGNFFKGLDDATDVIFKLASGEYKADQVARGRRNSKREDKGFPFSFLFILFFFIIPAIARRGRRGSYGSRGVPWWAWFMLGSGMNNNRRRNDWDNFRGGGGGFGGFGGGGGFGGFGGGSFGGGGSGGSW